MIFQHVLIERDGPRTGRAIAANGYIAAVVSVDLMEDDVPGLVDRQVFINRQEYEHIRLTKDKAVGLDWEESRFKNGLESFSYPDIGRVLASCSDPAPCTIAIDTQLLNRVCRAIGAKDVHLVTFGPENPIIVAPLYDQDGSFGLIMPIASEPRWTGTHYEQFMAASRAIADYAARPIAIAAAVGAEA